MATKSILTSWIGHADLRGMAATLPKASQEKLTKLVGAQRTGPGPIKTLLDQEKFDDIHLLSSYPSWVNKLFLSWIGTDATVHPAPTDDPTDYAEIFSVADGHLNRILEKQKSDAIELSILLSPGTPAMAAVWVLLGKSKYPAKFWQTYDGKASETTIPFDLVVDLIPEVLRNTDTAFHHLVTASPQDIEGFEQIAGNSKAIRLAVGRAKKAALRNVSVLLLGESGTGKELFARAIHAASPRKNGPFEVINCAAIPKDLLESELFGHEKGAFTGATGTKDGAFLRANGGTLFLDEIGECHPDLQSKLLRVLQPLRGKSLSTREFQPVGGKKVVSSDVRIVAATNRDLLHEVKLRSFREDLYYRLAVITVRIPPLRERRSDILAISGAIMDQINRDFESQEPGYEHKILSPDAIYFVKHAHWPGNIRQLFNALLQAAVMSEGKQIKAKDISSAVLESGQLHAIQPADEIELGGQFSLETHLQSIQRHFLEKAMNQAEGQKTKAAKLLGMKNYQTLDAQLKRLGIDSQRRK